MINFHFNENILLPFFYSSLHVCVLQFCYARVKQLLLDLSNLLWFITAVIPLGLMTMELLILVPADNVMSGKSSEYLSLCAYTSTKAHTD